MGIPIKVATEFRNLAQTWEFQHFLPHRQDRSLCHPQPPFSSWKTSSFLGSVATGLLYSRVQILG